MDAFVCNLSQGGLAISSAEVDDAGTECEVDIVLPGSADHIQLHGYIIWADTAGDAPVMGFSFNELSRDQRVALANFLLARFHNL